MSNITKMSSSIRRVKKEKIGYIMNLLRQFKSKCSSIEDHHAKGHKGDFSMYCTDGRNERYGRI